MQIWPLQHSCAKPRLAGFTRPALAASALAALL